MALRDQRRRRMAVLAVVSVAGFGAVALIGGGAHRGRVSATAPTTTARAATTPPGGATTGATSTTTAAPAFPMAVGTTAIVVDRGARRITVQVLHPEARSRPYPLIVFSPGFDIAPGAYRSLAAGWAADGFVVAVADYPFTAEGTAGGVDEADIVHHPADLHAVIDRMIAVSSAPGSELTGIVDPAHIGVAGHSDGGDVTDAVVADTCCRDPRIKAAAVLSGAEITSFGGVYGPPTVPLLVAQGDADPINAPACSEQVYDSAGATRFYLDLRGAGHLEPYTSAAGTHYRQAVDRVTTLFWRAYLGGDASSLTALRAGAGLGPDATLTAGVAVPRSGPCPGGPA